MRGGPRNVRWKHREVVWERVAESIRIEKNVGMGRPLGSSVRSGIGGENGEEVIFSEE